MLIASLKTLVFSYLYSCITVVFPFLVLRCWAYHSWTLKFLWIPLFDGCLPPAELRELTAIEGEKIAVVYCGIAILNFFNQSLKFFCDRDGK